MNIRYDDAQASIDAVMAGATGDFRDQYAKSTDGVIKVLAASNKSVMTGRGALDRRRRPGPRLRHRDRGHQRHRPEQADRATSRWPATSGCSCSCVSEKGSGSPATCSSCRDAATTPAPAASSRAPVARPRRVAGRRHAGDARRPVEPVEPLEPSRAGRSPRRSSRAAAEAPRTRAGRDAPDSASERPRSTRLRLACSTAAAPRWCWSAWSSSLALAAGRPARLGRARGDDADRRAARRSRS